MKHALKAVLGTCLALALAVSAQAVDFVLTDVDANVQRGDWSVSSKELNLDAKVPFTIANKVLKGGRQWGSEVLTIATDAFVIEVVPTRGMGVLSATGDGIRLGWNSPVNEVVNPAFMNLENRGGLGWLEGFGEMLVRCGYGWAGGAVEADGRLYTLHGRAGNTPASKVIVTVDEAAPHAISVKGLVKEGGFKNYAYEIWTELKYIPGEKSFTIHDTLTNVGDYAGDYQIIYHANFGPPLLEEGAKFSAPVREVAPSNDYSATMMDSWDTYLGPTRDFDEMVMNVFPYGDENGVTFTMLSNKAGDKGVGLAFDIDQLPLLNLWKNTETLKTGYVTGLEPSTTIPLPVPVAREHGFIRKIGPGESVRFDLTFSLLSNAGEVSEYQKKIDAIQKQGEAKIHAAPLYQ